MDVVTVIQRNDRTDVLDLMDKGDDIGSTFLRPRL